MIRLLKIPKIITAAVLLPIFLFGIVGAASYSGLIFERSSYRGYFSDNYDDEGEVVIHGIPSSVNSKQAFIEFLKQYNVSSDKQNKTGTAFIVCTMLNLTAINCAKSYLDSDRNITQAGWAELESRINNADVTMDTGNINIPFGTSFINSYYQGASTGSNPIDDAFYKDNNNGKGNASSGRNEPGFIFWYKGLAAGGIAAVGQLQLLQPFFGLVLAATLLGEAVSWSMVAVTAAVILCVAGARRFAR